MTTTYSALRSGKRIDLVEHSPLPAPLTIYVEPTNVCNFRCVYCPESFVEYREVAGGFHRMDAAGFRHVLDNISALGRLRTLNFYLLGEPFLNRALPDLIAEAVTRDVADRTAVTTNATVLDATMAERVLDSGLHYLRVSIYGGTEETAKARTQGRISLDQIAANLRSLREARDRRGSRLFLYVKMIDTTDPAENAAFLDRFRTLADEIAIEPVMNYNDPEGHNLAQKTREELLAHPHFQHRKRACPFPFYTLVIHADLRVSVCCVDWSKAAVVGDLKTESLRAIWNGSRLRDFRLAHLRGERHTLAACARCTYLYTTPDSVDALTPEVYLGRLPHDVAIP